MSQALKVSSRALSRVSSVDDVDFPQLVSSIAITTTLTAFTAATALTQQHQQFHFSQQTHELWNLLPVEVKELVVSFFDYKTLRAGAQVSHELKVKKKKEKNCFVIFSFRKKACDESLKKLNFDF